MTTLGRLHLASLLVLSAWLLGSSGGILLCRVSQVSSVTLPSIHLFSGHLVTAERGSR